MQHSIKETCKCGAVLEYSEVCTELWENDIEYRQNAFHKAHEACLKIPLELDG